MAQRFARLCRVWASLGVIALLGGCAHKLHNVMPDKIEADEWKHTYTAVVTTMPPDAQNVQRLSAYYKEMQDIAGTTNLEDQFIGCIGCARLATPNPPTELKFIFYRVNLDSMLAFTRAMKRVQSGPMADYRFVLTYTTDPPPGQACPLQCSPKAVCLIYSGCDGNAATAKCDKCPP